MDDQKTIAAVAAGRASTRPSEHKAALSAGKEVGPTAKRYVILLLFALNSGNKSYQWIQVPACTTQAARLYQVDNYVINFASIIFMLSFLVVSWPACFLIERIGIRRAVLLASLGALLGSSVKCFSVTSGPAQDASRAPDYEGNVYLLLLGQCLVSLGEQMIFSVPSRLVSVWFPDHQVGLATAFSIFGGLLGVAIGFLLPTQVYLAGAETRREIGAGFGAMFLATALFSGALFFFNWALFDEAPGRPPGEARRKQILVEQERAAARLRDNCQQPESTATRIRLLFAQILELCKNRDLMLVAVSYGLSLGRGDAISTLMDQTMGSLYPQEDSHSIAGLTGCAITAAGLLGLPLWGRLLDHYRDYKTINIILSVSTTLALALWAYVMIQLRWVAGAYLAALLFGFFQIGFVVACMDMAVELTYPAPELVTSSLLNSMPFAFGSVFVMIGSYIVDTYGALATHIFYLLTLIVSFLCILSVRGRLKRQEAIGESPTGAPAE